MHARPTRSRLTKEDGLIDWSRSAVDIHNLIRGLHPWPHAFTFWGDRRLILLRSSPSSGTTHALPGAVIAAHTDELRVATGDGHLQILEIQAEGKRPMTAREFLAGHHLEAGRSLRRPSMIAPARVAAYEILSTLSAGRADLPTAIAHARESLRDDRDRALAAEIATGVQRWRAALDYLIAHFAKRPLDRLDPEIVEILRLSAYQLLHLTRVPASAVVDDAVNLTGKVGKRSASGFVNAVLRALSRNRAALPLPPRPAHGCRSRARSRLFEHHALASAMARRALARPDRPRANRSVDAVQQHAAALVRFGPTVCASRVAELAAAALPRRRSSPVAADLRPDALIVEEGHPLRGPDG